MTTNSKNNTSSVQISPSLVRELIAEQFPQWGHLPIRPVAFMGMDNRTFRLGEDMSVRLPSAERYAEKVSKEQKWLPVLAPHLSISIPEPIALGQPSKGYPWSWSIYRWIEGESANSVVLNEAQLEKIAVDLAGFLGELQKIDGTGGLEPGPHNFWRGAHPSMYDMQTRSAINKLEGFIDTKAVTLVWEKALSSEWHKGPVWIHGDFSSGNIITKDGALTGVIDFGGMGIGDPACDLVIAWTFLKNKSREIFKEQVGLDSDTWARARGWALWKALITLDDLEDKASDNAKKLKQLIDEIINEHEGVDAR